MAETEAFQRLHEESVRREPIQPHGRRLPPKLIGSSTWPEKLAPSQYINTALLNLWNGFNAGWLLRRLFLCESGKSCQTLEVPLSVLLRTLHASKSVHQPPPTRCKSHELLYELDGAGE